MTLEYGDPSHLVNIKELSDQLRTVEASIRKLKEPLRKTWVKPMHDEQRTLLSLKRRATLLCALKALTRNREHVRSRPRTFSELDVWNAREYNLELARAALDRFELRQLTSPMAVAR